MNFGLAWNSKKNGNFQRPHVDDEPARRAGEEETWGLFKKCQAFFRHTDAVRVFQNIQMHKIRTKKISPFFDRNQWHTDAVRVFQNIQVGKICTKIIFLLFWPRINDILMPSKFVWKSIPPFFDQFFYIVSKKMGSLIIFCDFLAYTQKITYSILWANLLLSKGVDPP